jgi:hypothetical protein
MENGSSISEAVRRAGGKLILDASPNPDYFRTSFEGLKAESQLVVLAHLKPGTLPDVQLSNDGRSVVTHHEMIVGGIGWARDRRLMRNNPEEVVVEVPGGRFYFADGGVAEVINGPILEAGRRYILFLKPRSTRRSSDANPVYVVTGYHYEGIMPVAKVRGLYNPLLAPGTETLPLYDHAYVDSVFARLGSASAR